MNSSYHTEIVDDESQAESMKIFDPTKAKGFFKPSKTVTLEEITAMLSICGMTFEDPEDAISKGIDKSHFPNLEER